MLDTQKVELSSDSRDGRVNSIKDEDFILSLILNNYKNISIFLKNSLIVEKPKERYWYDFLIRNQDNTFYVPINIKVSSFSKKSSDNISSKQGLYFSLTGINEKPPNSWGKFFEELSINIKEHNSDYYFLVLNKDDKKFYFNSLRRLKSLTPNGNNLPFQCNWTESIKIVERSFQESKKFILGNLYNSIKKRAHILKEFEKSLKDFND